MTTRIITSLEAARRRRETTADLRGQHPSLVGRAAELALIDDFLARAAAEGGCLVLAGEPGVGKTALLQVAVDRAVTAGTRVVRAEGVEFETIDVFSGLSQILCSLSDGLETLLPAHRDALAVMLGLADGDPPKPPQVALAALNLIRSIAAGRPLLLVVDDLQWMDRSSADVLSYVVRRLGGSQAGFLAAARPGELAGFETAGMSRHDLAMLDPEAAQALLHARYPALAPRVAQRMLAEAEGNPLALLELPPALSGPQRAAGQPLPEVLPLTDRMQAVFAGRVSSLPAATRELLLLAVLLGPADYALLDRAVGGELLERLAPAERAGLVRADDSTRQLVFRHPLTRSAIVGMSTAQERRAAHQRLADSLVDEPERRICHLGAATVAPDEEVAALLHQQARRILRRGDPAAAAVLLSGAADLSPDPADRSARLAEAAFTVGTMAWQMERVSSLLAQARQAPLDAGAELHAVAADAYLMLNGDGDINSAHERLVAAINAFGGGFDANNRALLAATDALYMVCAFGGRADLWRPYLAVLARLTPAAPEANVLLTSGKDPVRATPAALRRLDEALVRLHATVDQDEIGKFTSAAVYVDRLPACREPLRRLIRGEQAGGAVTQAIGARGNLAVDAFLNGRWDDADQLIAEGVQSCAANGHLLFAQNFHYLDGLMAAVRGDHERAGRQVDALIRWGTPRGADLAGTWAAHIGALDAVGRGDFEAAYQNAAAISPPGNFPPFTATAVWVCLELVEAAMRTGRQEDAASHVAAMRAANLAAISPRLDFIVRVCAALAAGHDRPAQLFEAALGLPSLPQWPFDLARVRLAYGEQLRRAHATAAARQQLTAALAAFEQLGAQPWAARADAELRAAGASRDTSDTVLTWQEYEIAELAAAGLTNRQIGERLFLSHRTVSTHLYRVFPKLGITSRAALRDALATVSRPRRDGSLLLPQRDCGSTDALPDVRPPDWVAGAAGSLGGVEGPSSGWLWPPAGVIVRRMCDEPGRATAGQSAPRPAEGPAVDPVTLPAVDEVMITTLVDNTFDALLASAKGVARPRRGIGL
jgi:DNA-binding CsgD family transcriptional regulator